MILFSFGFFYFLNDVFLKYRASSLDGRLSRSDSYLFWRLRLVLSLAIQQNDPLLPLDWCTQEAIEGLTRFYSTPGQSLVLEQEDGEEEEVFTTAAFNLNLVRSLRFHKHSDVFIPFRINFVLSALPRLPSLHKTSSKLALRVFLKTLPPIPKVILFLKRLIPTSFLPSLSFKKILEKPTESRRPRKKRVTIRKVRNPRKRMKRRVIRLKRKGRKVADRIPRWMLISGLQDPMPQLLGPLAETRMTMWI
jgi:hypothetical protein